MLAKRIIPCLDVKDGRVVKGIHFKDLKDAGDPVASAILYDKEGADEIVFLDITASIQKRKIILEVVKRIAENIFIPFTVGGGIRTLEDIREILKSGADKVSINTCAVENPDIITKASAEFGSQCIVVAIDAKKIVSSRQLAMSREQKKLNRHSGWEVYIYSGTKPTGKDAVEWAKEVEKLGAGEILLTSIDFDGTKNGYDIELTRAISSSVKIPVIASGGAGKMKHIYDVFEKGKADAALAASIFHYGEIRIADLKKYLQKKGIPVRI